MKTHQIRGKLLAKGFTFSSWAKAHDFESRTVQQAVSRWAGKSGKPRGLTKSILDQISTLIGAPIYRPTR